MKLWGVLTSQDSVKAVNMKKALLAIEGVHYYQTPSQAAEPISFDQDGTMHLTAEGVQRLTSRFRGLYVNRVHWQGQFRN